MAGLQIDVYASIGITWFAALVALTMRMVARHMTRMKWWFDDYFSILAFLFATGHCAVLVEWTLHWSLGKYMPGSLDDSAREEILYRGGKLGFVASVCYGVSLGCSKISILLFYWRLFKFSVIRIPTLVVLAMSAIWLILRTFMQIFICVPTRAFWDTGVPNAVCRIDGDKLLLGTITAHFLLDVIILALPIVPVFRLRLPLPQKLAVVGFFMLGTIVCIASCVSLVILVRFPGDTKQFPYEYAALCIWGAVEVNLAVVSGNISCCPLLRPAIQRFCPYCFLSAQPSTPPTSARTLTAVGEKTKEEVNGTTSTRDIADAELASPENGGRDDLMIGAQPMS